MDQISNPLQIFGKKDRSLDDLYGGRSLDALYGPDKPEAPIGPREVNPVAKYSGEPEYDSYEYYNPNTGELADKVFTSNPVARVLTAFGQDAKAGWGAADDPNFRGTVQDLNKKIDAAKNWSETSKRVAKSFNEAFNRPLATVADAAWYDVSGAVKAGFGAGMGLLRGVSTEAVQASRAIKDDPLEPSWGVAKTLIAPALGAAGEIGMGVLPAQSYSYSEDPETGRVTANPDGGIWSFLPEGLAPARNYKGADGKARLFPRGSPPDLLQARSKGIIGEGEEGYFNTRELTPKQVEARIQAAKEAGLPPAEVTIDSPNPQLDANGLARKIDPDAFKEWDELYDLKDTLRSTIDYLGGKRGEKFDAEILNLESKYPDAASRPEAIQKQINNFKNRKAEAESKFTTDMEIFQNRLIETDVKIRDLIPRTADARRRAQELLESDTPEGSMFRDFIQEKALEYELRVMELEGDIKIAEAHAKSLMPDYSPTEQAKAKIKYDQELKKYEEKKAEYKPSETGESSPPVQPELPTELRGTTPSETIRTGEPQVLTEGVGREKVMGYAKSLEAKAIEDGLVEKFEGLPEMREVSIKDQANMISKYMDEDYLAAKRAVLGHDDLPPGMNRVLLANALERKALLENDVNFINELASSEVLNIQVSEAGRTLRFLQERDIASPVQAIQSIKEARQKKYAKQVKQEMEQMIKDGSLQKALDETTSSKSVWDDFIRAIECK